MTLIRVILVAILVISPLVSSAKAVAAEKTKKTNVYTGKEGGACHVVSGDNKGKSGTYDNEGDCAGDFGATVCTKDGKSNGKCADGTRTGSIHELLGDILLDQVLLFKDQQRDQQAILKVLGQISIKLDGLQAKASEFLNICTAADLVPVPIPGVTGPPGFCRRDSEGNLLLQVANQGGADAGFFTTVVFFKTGGDHSFFTTSLSAFSSVELSPPFPLQTGPFNCFDANGECHFTIVVDIDNLVAEFNEINNTVDGVCFAQIFRTTP